MIWKNILQNPHQSPKIFFQLLSDNTINKLKKVSIPHDFLSAPGLHPPRIDNAA